MRSYSRSRSAAGTSFESQTPGDVPVGMQDDGRGDDRAGEAAAPDFVDAGDVHEPDAAQRVLERAHARERGPWR